MRPLESCPLARCSFPCRRPSPAPTSARALRPPCVPPPPRGPPPHETPPPPPPPMSLPSPTPPSLSATSLTSPLGVAQALLPVLRKLNSPLFELLWHKPFLAVLLH